MSYPENPGYEREKLSDFFRRGDMATLADKNEGNENQNLSKKKVSSYEDRPLKKKLTNLADELEPDEDDKGFEGVADEDENEWEEQWSEGRPKRGEKAEPAAGKNIGGSAPGDDWFDVTAKKISTRS